MTMKRGQLRCSPQRKVLRIIYGGKQEIPASVARDEHKEGVDGCIAEELAPVDLVVGRVGGSEVLAGLRDVHPIALHQTVV